MKKETKVIFFVLIVSIILLFVFFSGEPPSPKDFTQERNVETFSNLLFNYEIVRYPSKVEITLPEPVNETLLIGFVVDPGNLIFGSVPTNGSYVKRSVEISNRGEGSTRVEFKTYGNITPFVSFSKNNFLLTEDEKITIDVFMMTNNASIGNYSGEIDVIIKKPKINFLMP